ncbi:unnamed protein product [Rotaria sp. Silwood2]|nr:unnamed protein product [Rotaria sp. Silwood2]
MISRYIFVCLYFISFFLINRVYDLYQYYFHLSTHNLFSQQIVSINQLNIEQLQHILNIRGITYININEKYDLIKMVEQTGSVRKSELSESLEDHTKRQTTIFSSYKQLLDFVDDCKDNIWFIHLLPNEKRRQSIIYLSPDKWQIIERRLSLFNIQTGILSCSNNEYSNLCRTLNTERFILLVPTINRHQGSNEHTNNTLLQYFSQDSLWLNQYSLLTINPNVNISNNRTINFKHLPVWRFTTRRRKPTHGASEYYSDIELEQSNNTNEQDCTLRKSFIHRRITNVVSTSQQDHFYTSETDENNNSLNSYQTEMNSSQIYQCSICLEKYFNNVYICTLPCLHHFHRKCLFNWLYNSEYNTCPLCRSSVMVE